jgi:urease accessory protein
VSERDPRSAPLAALLQLASPMLPVGAYAYSQGLERAVHDGLVVDAPGAARWIGDLLNGPVATFDAPVWLRLHRAAVAGDVASFARWNRRYLASRESHELRGETLQMGASLRALARELPWPAAQPMLDACDAITFPAAFAACAHAARLSEEDGLAAFLWGWLENQVAAVLKAVPLGQVAGQRLLFGLHGALDRASAVARELGDDELVSSAPGLALASALHETQYSRLFRS